MGCSCESEKYTVTDLSDKLSAFLQQMHLAKARQMGGLISANK